MYYNLTRNPVTIDGRLYPARPQPITPIVIERDDSPHATLTGFRGPVDLPFIPRDQSGQNTYILPRHPSSVGYLPQVRTSGVDFKILDLVRGQVDAADELDQMAYDLPQSAILPVSDLTYIRMVGGSHTINIENGPELKPIDQGARVWSDGSVFIPPFTPACHTGGGEVLILPFDGRILREAEKRWPDCFLAVLDEPRENQPTKLFLVKGPSGAWMLEAPPTDNDQDELEGLEDDPALDAASSVLLYDDPEIKKHPGVIAYLQSLEEYPKAVTCILDETPGEESARIQALEERDFVDPDDDPRDSDDPQFASGRDLRDNDPEELETEDEQDNTAKTDAEMLAEKLHQIIQSVTDLYQITSGLMQEVTALETRIINLESGTRQASPSIDTVITDSLIHEGKKLLAEFQPLVEELQKKSDAAKRQWVTRDGVEAWILRIADHTTYVVMPDGVIIETALGDGRWSVIDGPTPKTLPGINGPDGD